MCDGSTSHALGATLGVPPVRPSPAAQLCCGCIDASRPVLTRAIKRGENVILLPGGEKEMMLTDGNSKVTKPVPAGRPHPLLAC